VTKYSVCVERLFPKGTRKEVLMFMKDYCPNLNEVKGRVASPRKPERKGART
jgi:hypothetical protein